MGVFCFSRCDFDSDDVKGQSTNHRSTPQHRCDSYHALRASTLLQGRKKSSHYLLFFFFFFRCKCTVCNSGITHRCTAAHRVHTSQSFDCAVSFRSSRPWSLIGMVDTIVDAFESTSRLGHAQKVAALKSRIHTRRQISSSHNTAAHALRPGHVIPSSTEFGWITIKSTSTAQLQRTTSDLILLPSDEVVSRQLPVRPLLYTHRGVPPLCHRHFFN